MGNIATRRHRGVQEVDIQGNNAYKYPPQSGNYFGSHFIMGGERFDTPQPEAYLFGDSSDLNFLGNRPIPFPYPAPQPNEPTKTLKSLVNIRKDSVKLVRVEEDDNASAPAPVVKPKTSPKNPNSSSKKPKRSHSKDKSEDRNLEKDDKKKEERKKGVDKDDDSETTEVPPVDDNISYNIEFTFDTDVRCAITVYYFATEEMSNGQVSYHPKDASMNSETFHFKRGANQVFNQTTHIINPSKYNEDDWIYNGEKDIFPVVIHCIVEDEADHVGHSHTTVCNIERTSDGGFNLKPFKQKQMVDGLCYLLQEIFGIENKMERSKLQDEEVDDTGAECVICMCDIRDTLILPCRHLCLCNNCADNLRYQSNNCPICRSPFRALLQIRAMKKKITRNPEVAVTGEENPISQEGVPTGFEAISLIEALNGPMATSTPTSNTAPTPQQQIANGLPGLHSGPPLRSPYGTVTPPSQSPHTKRRSSKRQASLGETPLQDQPVLEEPEVQTSEERGQMLEGRGTPEVIMSDQPEVASKSKNEPQKVPLPRMRYPNTEASKEESDAATVELVNEVQTTPNKQISKSAENLGSAAIVQDGDNGKPLTKGSSSPIPTYRDLEAKEDAEFRAHSRNGRMYDTGMKGESDPLVNATGQSLEVVSLPGTPLSTTDGTDGSSFSSTSSTRGLLESKSPQKVDPTDKPLPN
ncbi:unnamed protein product [Owenia fusiformis]|uniref:RING-type E3 ubiquitin transferase n=1 Tax=Owenia fusiformis TaxID=6347 RepID=A0A8J1Y046_OWEFU|nr:unnamed protein product [Owenia fusiformis]CAH1795066.1 unnamed protein product [Owenia fusiformis]